MARRRSFPVRIMRWAALAGVALAILFAALVALYAIVPPVSTLMLARTATLRSYERTYVSLDRISPALASAVIASEDDGFCANDGVDWDSLREVLDDAGDGGPSRGASTLTMQTAKNLFLWPGRSSIRKGVEIGMALVLGQVWSKRRTLEVYLNIAEWGEGIFGAEAAAQRYFGKSADALNAREATLMATALPNPIKRNPAKPAAFHRRLAANLQGRAYDDPDRMRCLKR